MYIYKITNKINGKVYIGKTALKKAELRWNKHRSSLASGCHKNKHLQSAWNKYGEASFSFDVIEQFDPEMNFDLNNLERYWIKHFESMNPAKGYNKTEGGEGCSGFKMPRDVVERLSLLNKNRPSKLKGKPSNINQELRDKLSCLAKKKTGEKNPFFGRKHSDVTRLKMKSSWGEGRKLKHRKSKGKIIFCLNNNTVYESSTDAAEKLNLKSSSIRSVLQGKAKSIKGFRFEYYNEVLNVQAV